MSDRFRAAAFAIADSLCDEAIEFDGVATWFGDVRDNATGEWEVVNRSLDGDLYGGTAGIALFLVRTWKVEQRDRYRAAATAALAHASQWCDRTRPSNALYTGAGGVGLALHEASTTFGDSSLADEARRITIEAIGRPIDGHDLIGGRAGAVLALLDLGRALRNSDLVAEARELGTQIVAAAEVRVDRGASWPSEHNQDEPALCGLAHGASGTGLALTALANHTADRTAESLAFGAASYERAWFHREEHNWPDLREFSRRKLAAGETPPFPVFWCHGAVGIGLSRVARFRATREAVDAAEAGAAIQASISSFATTMTSEGITDASLCHGAAGIAELLIEGARAFDSPELTALATDCGHALIDSFDASGQWAPGVPGGLSNPSLMLGSAGVGTVLLRLANTDVLPVGLLYAGDMEGPRLIVQLRLGDQPAQAADTIRAGVEQMSSTVDGARVERISARGRVLLRVPASADVASTLQSLSDLDSVEYAEADGIERAQPTEA